MTNDWEKRFDEYGKRDGQHPFIWPNGNTNWDAVKSFISQEIEAAEKKGYQNAISDSFNSNGAQLDKIRQETRLDTIWKIREEIDRIDTHKFRYFNDEEKYIKKYDILSLPSLQLPDEKH